MAILSHSRPIVKDQKLPLCHRKGSEEIQDIFLDGARCNSDHPTVPVGVMTGKIIPVEHDSDSHLIQSAPTGHINVHQK